MSDISDDLRRQMSAGLQPSIKRFMEGKQAEGPTLTQAEEDKLRDEATKANQAKFEALEAKLAGR